MDPGKENPIAGALDDCIDDCSQKGLYEAVYLANWIGIEEDGRDGRGQTTPHMEYTVWCHCDVMIVEDDHKHRVYSHIHNLEVQKI